MDFIRRHRILLSILSFIFMGLPQEIAAIWFLAEKIRGAEILMPDISITWLSYITIPIGLIMLIIIILQGRESQIEFVPVSRKKDVILTNLTKLRSGGVALRNKGMNLDTTDKIDPWIKEVEEWNKATLSEIEKLSPAEAGIFRTLDWIKFPPFENTVNPEHNKYLRMLSQSLINLENLVRRYLQKNSSRNSNI